MMAPGIGGNIEEQFQRQMGCMTGFLQIFDRHQIIAGKRLYPAKRLRSSSTAGSASPSERSEFSSLSLPKALLRYPSSPSVEGCISSPEDHSPVSSPGRHTLPLPVFELKDGLKTSWKLREAPRLSLDSRAVVDAKGKLRPREIRTAWNLSEASEEGEKQRRSPSVVARLMGLEALPVSGNEEPLKRSELRRSASESCFPRDLSHFNFKKPSPVPPEESFALPKQDYSKPEVPRLPPSPPLQRKGFFDAQEFFPEPKRAGSIYGEIEKRLRMRGIEEPAKDLETLKQILESLQFKGLLHSKPPERRPRTSSPGQSPIVVMMPAPNPPPPPLYRSRSASPRRPPAPESTPPSRARRDMAKIDRNLQRPVRRSLRSPAPNEALRIPSCGSPARRRPLNAEGQKASLPQRRIASVHSSRTAPQRIGLDQRGARSSKNRKQTVEIPLKEGKVYSPAEEDISTTVSDSSIISSVSQFDFESATVVEHRDGRRLLERCDKLLHSIAAFTSSAEQVTTTDRQPSPVSVLDASTLLSDDSFASPTPKRSIDFQDHQLADWEDHWNNQATSTAGPKFNTGSQEETEEAAGYHGEDYAYVADVLHETDRHCNAADAFAAVEKRHCPAVSPSIHRRLVFDTVTELLDRKRSLPPWDAFSCAAHFLPSTAGDGSGGISLMSEVWEELQRIQERVVAEDVMDVIGGAISKDMAAVAAGEKSWAGTVGAELSEAVLHIERQVFKDLVADTIRELADLVGRCRANSFRRRRLVFEPPAMFK